MTRKEALAELIGNVEAGTFPGDATTQELFGVAPPTRLMVYAYEAFGGSLDAAKALHEAVLPGWPYTIENVTGQNYRAWTDKSRNLRRPGFSDRGPCPARAWLLAILRALYAQDGHDGWEISARRELCRKGEGDE